MWQCPATGMGDGNDIMILQLLLEYAQQGTHGRIKAAGRVTIMIWGTLWKGIVTNADYTMAILHENKRMPSVKCNNQGIVMPVRIILVSL